MSEKTFSVVPTRKFSDDVKFYIKKKKYIHINDDIKAITDELEKGNFIGDEIPGLKIEEGGHTYKVRSANTDAKVGKSNGYRILYYVILDDETIFLLTIYSKKDSARIPTNAEIVKLIAEEIL